jgi:hypothetical protein
MVVQVLNTKTWTRWHLGHRQSRPSRWISADGAIAAGGRLTPRAGPACLGC